MRPERDPSVESIEVDLLLEAVHRRYGFDLRGHARSALVRRLRRLASAQNTTLSALQGEVLRSDSRHRALLRQLTTHQRTFFEDPGVWSTFGQRVVPYLRTHPSLRIWHVGCGTGEETYSLAAALQAHGLLSKARVYATDVDAQLLAFAREGIYPAQPPELAARYGQTGLAGALADCLAPCEDGVRVTPAVRERVFFAEHHLSTDGSPNEFQLVVCRNVLLYLGPSAHRRAQARLHESLARFGFLVLGPRESLRATPLAQAYEEIDARWRIFRRIA